MVAQTSIKTNYLLGIATFIGLSAINIAAWFLFFNPKGIMRLYTPMYGFSMVVILLLGKQRQFARELAVKTDEHIFH